MLLGEIEYLSHSDRFLWVDFNFIQFPVLFAQSPALFQLVSVGRDTAPKPPFGYDLAQACLGANGGFNAFAGGLPIADVIHQLVYMVVEFLLPFFGAPDLDAVLDELLHDEGRFIFLSAQAVKHKYQQNIKLPLCGILLNLLYGVAVFCGNLEAGDAFFGKLFQDRPSLLFREIMAVLLLHRDIILFDLVFGGDPV